MLPKLLFKFYWLVPSLELCDELYGCLVVEAIFENILFICSLKQSSSLSTAVDVSPGQDCRLFIDLVRSIIILPAASAVAPKVPRMLGEIEAFGDKTLLEKSDSI